MPKPFQFSLGRMIGAVASLGVAAWLIAPLTCCPGIAAVPLAIVGVPASFGVAAWFLAGPSFRWIATGVLLGIIVIMVLAGFLV
jgi:hypothetical protein